MQYKKSKLLDVGYVQGVPMVPKIIHTVQQCKVTGLIKPLVILVTIINTLLKGSMFDGLSSRYCRGRDLRGLCVFCQFNGRSAMAGTAEDCVRFLNSAAGTAIAGTAEDCELLEAIDLRVCIMAMKCG